MYDQEVCKQLISIVHTLVLESKVVIGGFDEVLGRQGRHKFFKPLIWVVRFEGEVLIDRLSDVTLAGFIEEGRNSPSFFNHLGQQSLLLIFARLVQS